MECPNCNKTYDDDFKFCPYCGEEKPQSKICPICEMEEDIEFTFCLNCGTELVYKSQWVSKLEEKINECKENHKFVEAIEYYNKIIKLNPSNEDAWYEKGNLLKLLRKNKESKECYVKVNELNYKNTMTKYNSSRIYRKAKYLEKLKRYEEAIECYNKIIELEPDYKNVWLYKGLCLDKLGRQEEAKECYKKVELLRDILTTY